MPGKRRQRSATTIAARLDVALAMTDPGQMLRALAELDTKHSGIHFHERPEPVAMLGGLWAFYVDVKSGGMANFLNLSEGAGFHHTEEWCKRIGAKRTWAWLRAVAKLFPDGKVPQDHVARGDVLEDLEADTYIGSPPSALAQLAHKYEGAADELPQALKSYIDAHRQQIEAALNAPAQRNGPAKSLTEQATEGLAELKRMTRTVEASGNVRHLLAQDRGRPLGASKVDPRIARFLAALTTVDTQTWTRIALRHAARPRKLRTARDEVATVRIDLAMGRLLPPRQAKQVLSPSLEAGRRASERLNKLPETVTRNGKAFPLRLAAKLALADAVNVLVVYDWLVATQEGVGAAQTILASFQSVAPLP